jgi:hypothetical protein
MLEHYVEFNEPGALLPESSSHSVKDRIPAHLGKLPENTYALHYYDREKVKKGNETLTGKAKKKSPRIVFGVVKTLEDIGKERGTNNPLYRNIEREKTKKGILCNMGNWQPLLKDDIVIPTHKDLKTLTSAI